MKIFLAVGLALATGANFGFAFAARNNDVKKTNYMWSVIGLASLILFVVCVN